MFRISLIFLLAINSGSSAQQLQQVSIDQLNTILNEENGKTKVVNLWATWCGPCVKELPLFMQAKENFKNQELEFIFVSLDFQSQATQVASKINELNLKGSLLQLNENGNEWIEKFDSHWEGAIPYTLLILPGNKRIYHYDNFETITDLNNFLTSNLNH